MNPFRSIIKWSVALCISCSLSTPGFADVQIKHKPVKKAASSNRVLISASISADDGPIKDVRAYFKAETEERFYYVPMVEDEATYSGVLPAPAVGVGSVDYMIYAVGPNKQFVKTNRYNIKITDDEDALVRLQAKEPANLEINFDRLGELRDFARRAGQPDINTRVDVRTEVPGGSGPTNIPGFSDYIALGPGTPAAAGAGLASVATISTTAGLSTTALLGTAAAIGGAGALVSGGGGSDDSFANGTTVNLVGTWSGNGTTWQITTDSGRTWAGTSTPGGCGDEIVISGTRVGNSISAVFGNLQGNGRLTGNVSNNGNSISYTFQYNDGICQGVSGSDTLTRR